MALALVTTADGNTLKLRGDPALLARRLAEWVGATHGPCSLVLVADKVAAATLLSVPDFPEWLIAGREREYFTAFIKHECFDPDAVTQDALDEYVRCYAAPGGLRSMCAVSSCRAGISLPKSCPRELAQAYLAFFAA